MRRCPRCEAAVDPGGWDCPNCGPAETRGRIPILAPELLGEANRDDYPESAFAGRLEFERLNAYWFRPRARLIRWSLRRHFPAARSFFEMGCGSGVVLRSLAADRGLRRIVGGDASLSGLELAGRRAPEADLVQLDAHRLPFRSEFDVAGAFDVVEHFDEDADVLRSLVESVRPGGGVLLTVPQHPWLWSALDEASGHKRRYRRGDLRAKAEAAGLEILMITSYVFSLLPALGLARLRPRQAGTDPIEEAAGGVPLPGLIERILDAEVTLTERGARLPAGSSLLLTGRRRY